MLNQIRRRDSQPKGDKQTFSAVSVSAIGVVVASMRENETGIIVSVTSAEYYAGVHMRVFCVEVCVGIFCLFSFLNPVRDRSSK